MDFENKYSGEFSEDNFSDREFSDYNNYGDEDFSENNYENEFSDGDIIIEQKYAAGRGAFDRTAKGSFLGENTGNMLEQMTKEPIDIFRNNVNKIFYDISDSSISEKDLEILLEESYRLKKVQYKNPYAYILGYVASKNGTKINKTSFSRASSLLKKLNPKKIFVEKPDILRYARLWMNLRE